MITGKMLKKLKIKFKNNIENIIRNRILNKTALVDLASEYGDSYNKCFDIEIVTHNVVDQKQTGRCWSFAGLNILREEVIKKCNLNDFELSGSYIAFFDKLERFNSYMTRLIQYKSEGRDIYDRNVQDLLKTGFEDGSNFSEFKELIKKYGVVPKVNFSNSFNSNDTAELNDILSNLLRKFYLDLEKANSSNELKDDYIEKVYNILSSVYSLPPDKIDFEYVDTNNKYHIDKDITPKEFYDKYVGLDLENDYVEVFSFKDEKYKLNKSYVLEENNIISNDSGDVVLNLEYRRLIELIINQLKNDELVYFSSSTTTKYENGVWIDLMDRYSKLFGVDINLTNNELVRTYGTTGEHSMVIAGYNTNTKNWKIENSWGISEGDKGYFVMEDSFMKKYLISAVIKKKYLNYKELDLLQEEPIIVSKWDYKFC